MDQQTRAKLISKLLSTFKAFISFCKDNNLRYYVAGGTAIGAVRHKGLIPWDDDIDVYIPYDDYCRFLSLRKKLEGTDYGILTVEDKGNYLIFSKFYDKNTTIQEFRELPFVMGVYVDVFPLIESNLPYEKLKEFQENCWSHWQKVYHGGYRWNLGDFWNCIRTRHLGLFEHKMRDMFWFRPMASFYKNKARRMERSCYGSGKYCCCPWGYYGGKEVYESEWFKDTITMPFEGFEVEVPAGYHQYLTHIYGDYMQLPPEDQRYSIHARYYLNLKEGISAKEIERRKKLK